LRITSGIKEVAKRFGKFQQEISFYPLLCGFSARKTAGENL
jgi:hypothetical protein